VFGRPGPGLVSPYRTEDADLVVVALGSVLGTVQDLVDELRTEGVRVGALGITAFRPFPSAAVRAAVRDGQRLVVLERAFSVGGGGIVTPDVSAALAGLNCPLTTVVAGLGGRPVTRRAIRHLLTDLPADPLTFLDLDEAVIERELTRTGGAS
jgi:pyruvate ferredoxin oxidoreductase alpha subunit